MANIFADDFKSIVSESNTSQGVRIGRPITGLPFTQPEEFILAKSIMHVYEVDRVQLTPLVVKNQALKFATKINVYWDGTRYDVWYKEFLQRYPQLVNVLHPTENLFKKDFDMVLNDLRCKENAQKVVAGLRQPVVLANAVVPINRYDLVNVAISEDVEYVAYLDENIMKWRVKMPEEKLTRMYGNWLFNYRGFVSGLIVNFSSENDLEEAFYNILCCTVKGFIDPRYKSTGCSLIQELKDGLRAHPRHVFAFKGFYAETESVGDKLKWPTRRFSAARCSFAKLANDSELPIEFQMKLRLLLARHFEGVTLPYDPSPMRKLHFNMHRLLENTTDPNISYQLNDLFNCYVEYCTEHNYRPLKNTQAFSTAISAVFPQYTLIVEKQIPLD